MTVRDDIIAAAIGLLGTPYHHQGRLAGVGLDCVGVPIVVCWQLGLLPRDADITGYPTMPDGFSMVDGCDEHMTRTAAPQAGDVGVYRWGGCPQHMGILVPYRHGGLSIIHALGPHHPARVIESRILPRMSLVAAYMMPGIS